MLLVSCVSSTLFYSSHETLFANFEFSKDKLQIDTRTSFECHFRFFFVVFHLSILSSSMPIAQLFLSLCSLSSIEKLFSWLSTRIKMKMDEKETKRTAKYENCLFLFTQTGKMASKMLLSFNSFPAA